MKETTPLLIGTDENVASQTLHAWNAAKVTVQAVIDSYNKTGLPTLVTGELNSLINNTKVLLFEKITGGTLTFNGANNTAIDVHPEKAFDIIAHPAGCEQIFKSIEHLKELGLKGWHLANNGKLHLYVDHIAHHFIIDEKGLLQFSERQAHQIHEAGKKYLRTEKGQAMFGFLQATIKAYYESGLPNFYTDERHALAKIEKIIGKVQRLNYDAGTFTADLGAIQNEFDRE